MMPRVLFVVAATAAGCGSGGGFPDAPEIDAAPARGAFTLSWALTSTNSQPITCDQIGAQSVTALLRNRAVQGGSTEVFSCSTLMGTAQSLTPGTYDIDFELVGTGGVPTTGLITTAPKQMGIVIAPGATVPLAPLTFAVDATGGLKLHLTTAATAGNCVATGSGGSGITTNSISLTRSSDGMCAPITFSITGGGQPSRTYTVNCTSPVLVPCIERDQELSAAGVPSGGYAIRIRANGAAECYTNNDTFAVPPLGRDLIRTLNLGLQPTTAACQ